MKVVIIGGCGHIGYALDGVIRNPKQIKLCAYSTGISGDMPDETARLLENEYHAVRFDNWQNMLDSVKPDIAVIATRYDKNGVISLECLKRGINCFTEKAIAHSFEMLAELKKAARENNVEIIGMHGMRYSPEFYAAWQQVQSGILGNIAMFYGRKSYFFGNRRPDFYRRRSTFGGIIPWVATHALDWFCWIGGNIESVFAAHTCKANFGYGECESAAVISLRFSNGAVGTISADFLKSKNSGFPNDDQLRIAGDKSVLEVKYGKATLTGHNNSPVELELEPEGDFFGDFCRQLAGTGKCRLTMNDSFQVTELALTARQSADCENNKLLNIHKTHPH